MIPIGTIHVTTDRRFTSLVVPTNHVRTEPVLMTKHVQIIPTDSATTTVLTGMIHATTDRKFINHVALISLVKMDLV